MQQTRLLPASDTVKETEAGNAQPIATTTVSSCPEPPGLNFDTDQALSSAGKRTFSATPSQASADNVPQASTAAKRPIVIRATMKRSRAPQTGEDTNRHVSPRLRRTILLLTTLLALVATLITLVPLSADQRGFNLPSGLGNLIQSARNDLQNLASQNNAQASSNGGTSTHTSTGMPPMNIPHNQLVAIAQQDAAAAGISPVYFVRQINLESGFNPNAASPGGAEGIAQFEPGTAAGLGINPFDPIQALKAAAQMMGRAYRQYGDYAKALAAYNAGGANLQNAENACGAKWLSCMPAQTQNYVAVIMGV
jgi:hypothetical protein